MLFGGSRTFEQFKMTSSLAAPGNLRIPPEPATTLVVRTSRAGKIDRQYLKLRATPFRRTRKVLLISLPTFPWTLRTTDEPPRPSPNTPYSI